ncbi:MAG: hypothetical protein ABI142_02595 [Bryocella sp.]
MSKNVVLQFGNHVVKGQTDCESWFSDFSSSDDLITPLLRVTGSQADTQLSIEGAKAIFFVKTLEGTSHDEMRYFDNMLPLPCLWIRITFLDGEIIEGMIRNDSSYVFHSRFLMAPVDPECNNWLILVLKSQLANFQILGLRQMYKGLPELFHQP